MNSRLRGPAATRRSSAFTLIELLVVIAIIAILAAILFPVFAQAREKARQASCLSNTKQIGLGVYQYIQDYDEILPMAGYKTAPAPAGIQSRWYHDIYPYIKSVAVFTCPSKNEPDATGADTFTPYLAAEGSVIPNTSGTTWANVGPSSAGGYGINQNLVGYPFYQSNSPSLSLADIKDSAGTFIVAEAAETAYMNPGIPTTAGNNPAIWIKYQRSAADWNCTPPSPLRPSSGSAYTSGDYKYQPSKFVASTNNLRLPMARHNGGLNVIYCDGHAKWSQIEQFLGIPNNGVDPAPSYNGYAYGDSKNSWDDK